MRISNGASGKPKETPRPDLQAVLRHYGSFAEHSGVHLCVVHDESRPSMSVDLDKQVVNCHSCGFGGDAYSIIQHKEGLDFHGAVSFAESTGFDGATPSQQEGATVLGRKRAAPRKERGGRTGWKRPW